jgi:magnesium-transporting ATPase (P-type)|tara:strand:+ start:561 stop:794 length:234 start_codon:yes stop_codon:yes gene_type:complete
MQCIPDISITGGQPAMLLPLVLVILASMIKDAFEDWKRHQNDKKENEEMQTEVYDVKTGEFAPKMWKQVLVGQVVKV